MIGFELRWLGWDMDIIDHCTRGKGNLNRNPYCSCSHSTPIPFWTMKRNEREGEMGCGWRWVEKWDLKLLVMTVTIMPLRMLFVCSPLCCYCVCSLCFRLFVYVFTCIHEQARAHSLLTFYLQTRNLDSPTERGGLWYESCRWWGVTFSGGVISAER